MKKTILVIDDDKKFSLGLVAVLRREGFEVSTAFDGTQGLAALRSTKPDIIICDMMMPPPNGIQLKKELANDPILANIPFIFLTARTAHMDRLAGLQSGADDYITKPFEVTELLARIQSVFRQEERGHARGLQESLADLARLRASVSANTNPEVRTPLTAVLSTLELVLKDKFLLENGEADEESNPDVLSTYRLKFLVEDLEMLNEIDQNRLKSISQRIDFNFHLKNPINQVLYLWKSKKLHVVFTINPLAEIFAPRTEFGHIIAHLVDNACKFSPQMGQVEISVQPADSGGCNIELTNAGPGIPRELREKVFNRFYQVDQGEGLGIGLTIARIFARAWGGDVIILDSPSGCRVQMFLPPVQSE